MALFVLRKLFLQIHMCSHPVGLDVPLSTSILHICKQWRLRRDCVNAQAHQSLRWSVISTIISWAGSYVHLHLNSLCYLYKEALGPWLFIQHWQITDQIALMHMLIWVSSPGAHLLCKFCYVPAHFLSRLHDPSIVTTNVTILIHHLCSVLKRVCKIYSLMILIKIYRNINKDTSHIVISI